MNKKRIKRIREWLRRNQGRVFCECGCGKPIKLTEAHYNRGRRKPRYIQGHNLRDTDTRSKSKKKVKNIWDTLSEEEKRRRLDNLQKFESGKDNPNWGGGRFKNTSGYMSVLDPDHPYAVNGYVLEHRLVIEQWLREHEPDSPHLIEIRGVLYLKPGVVIHHIDEQKDNNALHNLYVFSCAAEHCFFHKSPLPTRKKLELIQSGAYKKETNDDRNK